MADTPANANIYTWLTSLSPAVIGLLSALTGVLVGGAGAWAVKPAPIASGPILAADAPRATPISCAQDFHDLDAKAAAIRTDLALIKTDLTELRALAAERFPAPAPRRAPSKTKAAVVQ